MKDCWKSIQGYEGFYEINPQGGVRSVTRTIRGRLFEMTHLRQRPHCNGYKRISLRKNNLHTTFYIHRLVAIAFIPNPENKPFVNHIDGVKTNNHVSNLEWNTEGENTRHYYAMAAKIKEENENF